VFSHVELRDRPPPSSLSPSAINTLLSRSTSVEADHLVSLPEQRQLVAVDRTFHHVDVVVVDTEVEVPEPEDHAEDRALQLASR